MIFLAQNYFNFQNKIYQPQKGMSMGEPISSTIAGIFLQITKKEISKFTEKLLSQHPGYLLAGCQLLQPISVTLNVITMNVTVR
jgi:hypothetical protein